MNDFVQNETFSSLYVVNLNLNKILNFSGIFESQNNGKPLFGGLGIFCDYFHANLKQFSVKYKKKEF